MDTAYPYSAAAIGHWGYDLVSGESKAPGAKDYMSYCGPTWTSDYTYHGIAEAWGWLNQPFTGLAAASQALLVVSGERADDGTYTVAPVFSGSAAPAPAKTNEAPAPTHRLELLDADGQVLSTTPFAMDELVLEAAHLGGHDEAHEAVAAAAASPASFRVTVPAVDGLAGFRIYDGNSLVYERWSSGKAPDLPAGGLEQLDGVALGSSAADEATGLQYRVRFSPDGGETWYLLAAAAFTASVEVPTALLKGAASPLVEVQASDGVRVDRQVYPYQAP